MTLIVHVPMCHFLCTSSSYCPMTNSYTPSIHQAFQYSRYKTPVDYRQTGTNCNPTGTPHDAQENKPYATKIKVHYIKYRYTPV